MIKALMILKIETFFILIGFILAILSLFYPSHPKHAMSYFLFWAMIFAWFGSIVSNFRDKRTIRLYRRLK